MKLERAITIVIALLLTRMAMLDIGTFTAYLRVYTDRALASPEVVVAFTAMTLSIAATVFTLEYLRRTR